MSKIEKLIREYQPSESVRQLVIQTKIVLLVGISGAGKDTTKQRLMQSPEFADIVSYTTRQPRQNKGIWEREGIDYNSKAWGTSKNSKGLRDALQGGLSRTVGILILFLLLSGVLRGLLYGGSAGLLSLLDTLKPSAIAAGLASCALIVILGSSERRPE